MFCTPLNFCPSLQALKRSVKNRRHGVSKATPFRAGVGRYQSPNYYCVPVSPPPLGLVPLSPGPCMLVPSRPLRLTVETDSARFTSDSK